MRKDSLTTRHIMREVDFTKDQFQKARKNPVVDFLLKQFKINDHKRTTTYKKLFELRDIDKKRRATKALD